MKYVAITFDDGRDDNYFVAFPILRENGFRATVFCTTGFIDGTWKKKSDWYSAERPLSIDQLMELKDSGWEIALHGDKHVTEINDIREAIGKMEKWHFFNQNIGHSLPDSVGDQKNLNEVLDALYPDTISYIRAGRGVDTKKLKYRLLFALYTYCKSQIAYNLFNRKSIATLSDLDKTSIRSIVVRQKDNPSMLTKFIKKAPDDSVIVFMFHSIHGKKNLYKNDPWNWSKEKFELFAHGIRELGNEVNVTTLKEIVLKHDKVAGETK